MPHAVRPLLLGLLLEGAAYAGDEHATAGTVGMGGTGVANPVDTTAIRTNPGAIALADRYDLQGLVGFGTGKDLRWGAAVVDARTSEVFAFGISYMGGRTTPSFFADEAPPFIPEGATVENAFISHDIQLSLAAPFLQRRLSVGLGGDVSILRNQWSGNSVTGNLSVGIAARPIEMFSVGFAARDILPIQGQAARPAHLVLGVRGGPEDIVVGNAEAEWRAEDGPGNDWTARAGVQGAIQLARLRAGWQYTGMDDTHRLAWGVGIALDAGGIDYSMQIPVASGKVGPGDLVHMLTLSLHINALAGGRSDEDEDSGLQWREQ